MIPAGAASLWTFATRLYAEPGIERLCLELQDEQDVNVLLLLWAAWLEVRSLQLTPASLASAQARVAAVSDRYLAPVRHVRLSLKDEGSLAAPVIDEMRNHLLRAELVLEKQLLEELQTIAGDASMIDDDTDALSLLLAGYGLTERAHWLPALRAAAARVSQQLDADQ